MNSARIFITLFLVTIGVTGLAQTVTVTPDAANKKVTIRIDNELFTEFIYPDSLEKPVLYPIYTANGELITRGFPIVPRANEPVDHPHHIGLWMNYENVNGLDFWNNSSAIAANKKALYGWIKTTAIAEVKSGDKGKLVYNANWQDINNNVLLEENTAFTFFVKENIRIIERVTTLKAMQDVTMPDVKDGFIGLRVAHELELPSKEEKKFTDDKGNVTNVKSANDATGNYISSDGIKGDSVWATRAQWCMLYGKKGNDSISIVMIDHPKNVGYPTYWHARGYGLFAANPLGQKIFSKGKEELNFSLKKGDAVTFRYRILIASGKQQLTREEIEMCAKDFL